MVRKASKALAILAGALLIGCASGEGGSGRWPVSVSDGRVWRAMEDYPPGWTRMANEPERMTTIWVRATAGGRPIRLVHAERLAESSARLARSFQECGSSDCPPRSPPPANLVSTPERQAEAERLFRTSFELFQRGEFTAAANGFQRGLNYGYQPANAVANFYYAETLMRLGRYRDAAWRYAMVPHLARGTPEALQAQQRLANFGREPDGTLSPDVVANIERFMFVYAVTDRLNRHKNCGFPTGRRFFIDDLFTARVDGLQISRLTAAYDREVSTLDWRSDCEGYATNALNPRNGNAAIPRMWDLYNSQTFLSLLYDTSSSYSTEDRQRFRTEGLLGPNE